jgi:uncharacterized protein
MKLKIKVKPDSGKKEIVEFGDRQYLVYLEERAEDNKANIELLRMLSKKLGVPSTCMKIVAGATNVDKLIEVEEKWL